MQLVGVGELPQGSCHLQLVHLLHPLVHSGQWLHTHQLRRESQRLHRDCQHLDLIVLDVPRSHQADLRMVHPLHSIPLGIHHSHHNHSLPHRDRHCRLSCRNLYHFGVLWNFHIPYQTSHTVVG